MKSFDISQLICYRCNSVGTFEYKPQMTRRKGKPIKVKTVRCECGSYVFITGMNKDRK